MNLFPETSWRSTMDEEQAKDLLMEREQAEQEEQALEDHYQELWMDLQREAQEDWDY